MCAIAGRLHLYGVDLAPFAYKEINLIIFLFFFKLIQDKVDILHVSAGGEPDFAVTHPPMFAEPGVNVYLWENYIISSNL